MGKIAIGYADKIKGSSVVASSAVASLPASYVLNDQVQKVWRTLNGVTTATLLFDFGQTVNVDGVGLINTNLTPSGTWRIRVSTSDPTGVDGSAYDSTTVNAGVSLSYKKAVMLFPTTVTGRYMLITLTDASLTYLQTGRVWCGTFYRPTFNYAFGAGFAYRSFSRQSTGDDGSQWVLRNNTQRGFGFTLANIPDTERTTHLENIILGEGIHNNLLVVRDMASSNLGQDTIYGLVEDIQRVTLDYLNGSSVSIALWDRI